jgi:TPR repeat protein
MRNIRSSFLLLFFSRFVVVRQGLASAFSGNLLGNNHIYGVEKPLWHPYLSTGNPQDLSCTSTSPLEELVAQTSDAAERGDVQAQNILGILYERGIGVRANPAKALECFRAAANRDDPVGLSLVGRAYADGRGVAPDDKEARVWFRKGAQSQLQAFSSRSLSPRAGIDGEIRAAGSGNLLAIVRAGQMYLTGEGVEQSDTEAARWLAKGAEQGLCGAEQSLALMYQDGRGGLPKDKAEALRLYRQAAEHNVRNIEAALSFTCMMSTGSPDCRGTR